MTAIDRVMLELAEYGDASMYGYNENEVRAAAREDGVSVRFRYNKYGDLVRVYLRKVGLGH